MRKAWGGGGGGGEFIDLGEGGGTSPAPPLPWINP